MHNQLRNSLTQRGDNVKCPVFLIKSPLSHVNSHNGPRLNQVISQSRQQPCVRKTPMVFGVWKQRKSFCWTTYMPWMEERNVISWNNSNQGYVKSGDMVKAWVIFKAVPMKYLALFECDRFLCLEYFRNYSNS